MSTEYLFDLLVALDQRYKGIRLTHQGGQVSLDDMGETGFEQMAQIIDIVKSPVLRMHTPLPCAESIRIRLKENDAGLWDVWMEGPKTAELDINDIVGELKERYS